MGGECPECGGLDTHYIMMMPVGYFKCFSCNHTWLPGVPKEPLVKLGKDSWIPFEDEDDEILPTLQVGYNYDEHVHWFLVIGGKIRLVNWFIQAEVVKGEFAYQEQYAYCQESYDLGGIA